MDKNTRFLIYIYREISIVNENTRFIYIFREISLVNENTRFLIYIYGEISLVNENTRFLIYIERDFYHERKYNILKL